MHPNQWQTGRTPIGLSAGHTERIALKTSRGCLQYQNTRSAQSQLTEVHGMPILGDAIDGGVLAHGGHDDSVWQSQFA